MPPDPTKRRSPGNPDILVAEKLRAGYGPTIVLEDIDLTIEAGESVSLIGRNGVGKTTLLKTLMGQTRLHGGRLTVTDKDVTRWRGFQRNRHGVGLVPQEREIFPSLTVTENLTVARRPGSWTTESVFDLFPRLAERRSNMGNQLSGGEQQMLAIGRALMGNPRLLLLDEPSEGLAPVIVDQLLDAMARLRADDGLTLILVEQHTAIALQFSPRTLVMNRGRIVFDGPSGELRDDEEKLNAFTGVAAEAA